MPGIRTASKLFALGLVAGWGVFAVLPTQKAGAVAGGGITLSPAAITLRLAPNATAQQAAFTITNQYGVPITLHFAVEKSPNNVKTGHDVAAQLSLASDTLTLQPGQNGVQTIRLTDSAQLPPGSQLASLAVS